MTQEQRLPSDDLEWIGSRLEPFTPFLRDADVLLTGGTGFFGKWLLESLLHFSQAESLGVRVHLLTRSRETFLRRYPHFGAPPYASQIHWVESDILDLKSLNVEKIDYVIHAATDTRTPQNAEEAHSVFKGIVTGTERMLDAVAGRGVKKFLLTSSGAVYGNQPTTLSQMSETYSGALEGGSFLNSYAEGKRAAETLCALAAKAHGFDHGFDLMLARCFAFVGPHLPLDMHYAAGNFIRDALSGGPIQVSGDGTPLRSYLYAADLVVWLLTLLFRGEPGRPYNVGSDQAISIKDLAQMIARIHEVQTGREIKAVVQKKADPIVGAPSRYIPSIERARSELGLEIHTDLEQAFGKTLEWYRARPFP